MYAEGLGIPKDVSNAIPLFERVAEAEFFAAIDLARIYARGVDVPSSPVKALRWYSVAAGMEGIDACDETDEARSYVR